MDEQAGDLTGALTATLENLAFLLDAAAATPESFDLETVLGRARRAVAALDAVLKMADGADAAGADAVRSVKLREAIARELPYGSAHE